LVQQHERALVGHVEIAGERERRLALDLVAEDRDGGEIAAQRQLVGSKQRPAGQREVLFTGPATEAGCALQASAVVSIDAPTMAAYRLAFGFGPTDATEGYFGLRVLHGENGRQRKALGAAGKEEMLGHWSISRFVRVSYVIPHGLSTQNITCDTP